MQGSAEIDYGHEGLTCVIDLPKSHVLPEEHARYRAVLDALGERHHAP